MNFYKITFILAFIFISLDLNAQGCVAVRGMSNCSGGIGTSFGLSKGEFFIGTDFRYFQSFRHFRGSEEEKYRLQEGTEVINDSYFVDFFVNYGITDRLFASASIPFAFHHRSSMYEHGGNPPNGLGERHSTQSSGLSDIRFGLGYWLLDPAKANKFNVSTSLGMKLATGDYEVVGDFYNQGPNRDETRTSVVDQSIQLGDGGVGVSLEMQAFYRLNNSVMMTGNFFYLSNPAATNGVLIRNGSAEFSVPDQVAARVGAFYLTPLKGFNVYIGGRYEAVPHTDLIGSSEGYRRPGYVVSVEPGLNYSVGNISFNLNVPIAVVRNRTQSFLDKERTQQTGIYAHGDAAFADYLINFSAVYRIGKSHMDMPVGPGM